jgi:hypothetical protein
MKEIKDFLSKLLIADVITPDLRKEALQLRDTIDLCKTRKNIGVITGIGFTLTYPGTINGERGHTLSMRDITECERIARGNHSLQRLSKIGMIKQFRLKNGCGLKEAKEVVEWLMNNDVINIDR